jgi:diguanylate cyclase (GGDEF)-like protein/PAS domain S-box-containing protein
VSDVTPENLMQGVVRGLVDSIHDAVFVIDDRERIILTNEAAERMFGYTGEELLAGGVGRVLAEPHLGRFRDLVTERASPEAPSAVQAELSGVHKDGFELQVEVRVRGVEASGRRLVVMAVRDLTDVRRVLELNGWLTAIVKSTGDAVVGLSSDGVIASWNPAAERLYGYAAQEVIGRSGEMLMPPERKHEQGYVRTRTLGGEVVAQLETDGLHKTGTKIPLAITASPIRDERDRVIGLAWIARDITERRRFEHELKFLADHDPLTGLFNRRRFAEELARQVCYVQRYPEAPAALLMGDLDNFKFINDTVGHKAGDELIKGVGHVLRARVRDTDVIARLGGDEFAVLLAHSDLQVAAAAAESLRKAVADYRVVLDNNLLHATASIGVAPINPELTAEDSMAAADIAMYEAKKGGRDRVAVVDTSDRKEDYRRHLGWSKRLSTALEENRFELYAQPILETTSGVCKRRELLLRMREDGELIAASAFIYSAERFGVIEQIDRFVIANAIRRSAEDATDNTTYHVNVSGVSIVHSDLLEFVRGELAANNADPTRLTLEITETAAIVDLDAARRFARGLREIGCTLALDDFGAGFGSFSYLKYIPVGFLKIDGSFVSGMDENKDDRLLVKAIIDVAHGMQIKAIAESVASDRARDTLREYGADYLQGFHLGMPEPTAGLSIDAAG